MNADEKTHLEAFLFGLFTVLGRHKLLTEYLSGIQFPKTKSVEIHDLEG